APLLIDFNSARDNLPDAALPATTCYPGGRGRVEFHVKSAVASHSKRFGIKPAGVWPAEGAISDAFVHILVENGTQWIASGQGVLANSLQKSYPNQPILDNGTYLYQPYRFDTG